MQQQNIHSSNCCWHNCVKCYCCHAHSPLSFVRGYKSSVCVFVATPLLVQFRVCLQQVANGKSCRLPQKNDFIVIDRRVYRLSASSTSKFPSLTHLRLFKLHIIDSICYRLVFYRFYSFNLKFLLFWGNLRH